MDTRQYSNLPEFLSVTDVKKMLNDKQIQKKNIYDLLIPTMYGLLEDLSPGSTLANEFFEEWTNFEEVMGERDLIEVLDYGKWVYYPLHNHLVRYADKKWHKLALVVRNSILVSTFDKPFDWNQSRKILDKMNIGLCGASVGNNILHSSVMLLRPNSVKIADAKNYQVNNGNRVKLHYSELNINKAEVCASQLHSLDPFLNINIYSDGIIPENIETFVAGGGKESPLDLIIEETDDPYTKIMIREWARKFKIPVVMVTDIGSMIQVDVRRFDKDEKLSLCPFVSDETLYQSKVELDKDIGNRKKFFEFIYNVSGRESLEICPEFWKVIHNQVESSFAGIPQLGSTAQAAGGVCAHLISRILLGHKVHERIAIELNSNKSYTWGKEL